MLDTTLESHGSRYLVLELVEGQTLADMLAERGALPLDEALNIAKQICEALEETVANVLKNEPDWTRVTGDNPAALQFLLRHCLMKALKNRFHSASDVRLYLESPNLNERTRPTSSFGSRRAERLASLLIAAALILVVVFVIRRSEHVDAVPNFRTPDIPLEKLVRFLII